MENILTKKDIQAYKRISFNRAKTNIIGWFVVTILIETGLRAQELLNLKWSDYDKKNCLFNIIGKGNKERNIIISNYLYESLRYYVKHHKYISKANIKTSDHVIVSELGTHLTTRDIRRIVERELIESIGKTSTFPHMLRASFCTSLLEGGAEVMEVQKMMGHSRLETTSIYYRKTIESKRTLINQYLN